MSERDIDAEFDAIVAHWDDDPPQLPKPRTVQDITTAYAALSRPETPSSEPVDETAESTPPVSTPSESSPSESTAAETAASESVPSETAPPESLGQPVADAEGAALAPTELPEVWREGPSIDAEDEDHFEPGPVQLPPSEDIGYWGAIVGLVGGPLLMLWIALTGPFYRGWWILGSIALFLGGFALLVMRSPRLRDPHDDDGARV